MKRDRDLTKAHLVAELRYFVKEGGSFFWDPIYERSGYQEHTGERLLAGALAEHIGRNAPEPTGGINWNVDLHKHMADAFVDFRTLPEWEPLRKAYTSEVGYDIPDMVACHIGGLHRILVVMKLCHLMTVLTREVWLKEHLASYFGAQQACIDQAWHRFVRTGYRQLMPVSTASSDRGFSGKFGTTTLMTYEMAGRTMFTFQRGRGGDRRTVSFVADSSDMGGQRSGGNVSAEPYDECVSMIDEVTDRWDLAEMKVDKIGLGF